ncbi:taurine transport system permease protein [Sporobacter termitidis DSM 10068]|uniref:Taurine transport system permease protein n=1 Tax=Sporobacter termitidis DSM 10068 TaxID=1123282 RepID=A0A1M5UU02_9FIRM|nr:ABC transporter permease [Sporobacter termitidis]SHH66406.1 taurine transport system permease protein [Sporobacter termitidis DSM 10068]
MEGRRINTISKRYLISILTGVVILILWTVVTWNHRISSIIIPSPAEMWNTFLELLEKGYKGHTLWEHLFASLRRLLIAYVLAVGTAIPLGLLSGYSDKIRAVFEPIIAFIRPLPPLGYYTIIILWMGIGDSSKIFLLYLGAFAPIFVSCVAGVTRVKQDYINRARTLGAGKRQVFFHVILPSSLPDIFVGLRNAMSGAYATSVAAEMVAAVSGIGWMVLDASKYLRSDVIFVGIIIMGVTGILLDRILLYLEKKIVFWKGKS